MTHLAQQEAFESPPSRSIIVPRGCEAHWGVDVGTRAVSVACVSRGPQNVLQRSVVTVPLVVSNGGERLGRAYSMIRDELQKALNAGRLERPGFVLMEQPGFPPNPKTRQPVINWPLAYMVGTVQAAVWWGAFGDGFGPCIETMSPPEWKKVAVGSGRIPKPTRKLLGRTPVFMDYGVAAWARDHGYEGLDWNEADAWGVAEAARRTVALDPR